MKKALLALLIMVPIKSFSAEVEAGFENEQYNHKYRSSDIFNPYVATSFNPIPDSKLNVSIKYMYQDDYGKKHEEQSNKKFKTDRDRFELYLKGYSYSIGDFTFAPQAGFRYEAWDINYENPDKQDKRKLELRLFPNMTYRLSKATNLYLSGFVAPVFMETKQRSRKGAHYNANDLATRHYNGDYYQELQLIGIKHKINQDNTVWSSLYNERKYSQDSARYDRWQLRVGYEANLFSDLTLKPYIRYDLSYKEKNIENSQYSADHGKTRSKNETRIGTEVNYSVTSTVSVLGEVYWQTAKVESYSGVSDDDKNRMFYKLAVRKSF